MNHFTLIVVMASVITACAIQPQYGDFTKSQTDVTAILVKDSMTHLKSLYPPASTKFALKQKIDLTDTFGKDFVLSLREEGYGLEMFPDQPPSNVPASTSNSIPLNYVVDHSMNLGRRILFIKLILGQDVLSRAYRVNDGGKALVPAGEWARMGSQ